MKGGYSSVKKDTAKIETTQGKNPFTKTRSYIIPLDNQ